MTATALPVPTLHRTGEGPPVLLLHPLGVGRSFWDGVTPLLDGFELLSYDFPGHGGAPVPERPYSIEDLTEQAAALLRGVEGGPIDVVGVSLGGLVAQRLAADFPELVRRLVVVDAVAVYPPALRQQWRDRAEATPSQGLEPLLDATLSLWFTADLLASGAPVVEQVRQDFLAGQPQGYAAACRALEQVDLTEAVERIRVPTLVLCGEDDAPPFTAAARRFVETHAEARLVWLSPARHAGVLEQPEQFAAAVTEFLREGSAG